VHPLPAVSIDARAAVFIDASPLERRDLTDPSQGPHAIQHVLRAAIASLGPATSCQPVVDRASSAAIPALTLARALSAKPCPGAVVVRPRVITDGPAQRHELEIWWVRRSEPLGLRELGRWIGAAMAATAPGFTVSAVPATTHHAADGRHVDVRLCGRWVTVATSGVLDSRLLVRAGLPSDASGLVLALDLDLLVLLAKGMEDRALLYASEPAVASQMLDLEPYLPPALARPLLSVV
jgi:phenylalanyl-tRNA synthetase alpha chain